MIYESLKIVSFELNNYLDSVESQTDDLVVLGNIAQLESSTIPGSSTPDLLNKVVITLLSTEEDSTLKNVSGNTIRNNTSTEYENPPVNLNLYIIVSSTSTVYENALKYLSRVISFFQAKNVFTQKNTPLNNITGIELDEFKLIFELYSPTFEESNFLWSTLGGKQMPSVVYKIRMIQLEREHKLESRGLITEIEISEKLK